MLDEVNHKAGINERVTETLLIIYFLFLILYPVASIVSLILLTVYIFFSRKISVSLSRIRKDTGLKIFIGYFLLHVAGLIYSENIPYGLSDIQSKLSYLLIPLVFSAINFSEKLFGKIKLTFIIASAVSLLILLALSLNKFLVNSHIDEFFYSKLTHVGHSTYIAIYFNLALLFIQEIIYDDKRRISPILAGLLFYFLFIGILLLSARTSIFVAIVSLSVFPFMICRNNSSINAKWKRILMNILVMVTLFFVYLQFNNRFTQVEQAIVSIEHENKSDSLPSDDPNSTNIRFHLWQNSIQLIGEHPVFGVGTGDIKEELVKKYAENNYQYGVRERISPHNQFLHTGVILGMVGILFLLLYFMYPMILSFKEKDWMYFIFLIIILSNCMTESILERQAGILFFTAFNTCFYLRLRKVSLKQDD